MLFRKPLPPWIGVSLFVVAVVILSLIGPVRRRPNSLPGSLTELAELLSQKAFSLYVVPVMESKPESGIYICAQPHLREQLMYLLRDPNVIGTSRMGKWEGVVFCERVENFGVIEEPDLQSWGEHGMRIGSFLFFGDPVLLQRIRTAILGEHHA